MTNKDPYVRVRLDGATLDVIEDQATKNDCSREARLRYLLRIALRLQGLVKRPAVLAALAEPANADPAAEQQIRQILQTALSGN
jgi:hypothetical protein